MTVVEMIMELWVLVTWLDEAVVVGGLSSGSKPFLGWPDGSGTEVYTVTVAADDDVVVENKLGEAV
jgi:hypothetical protein